MIKKLKNTDYLFLISLIAAGLVLSIYLFTHLYLYDESFYASIPYRLTNGDSLVQHEWHLSQFSSLFSYLPVRIWVALKGSAEGMIVFLRCVYAMIHTTVTVIIYVFFRKYGNWAIAAAMIFFTQTPYRIIAISYNSMFVIFTLLLTLCLISIYENSSVRFYILAGVCFGCCCICNPLFSVAFVLYLITCALWLKREILRDVVIKIKICSATRREKNIHKKQKNKKKKFDALPNMENYNCFFNKKAVIYFFFGILIIATIAVIFFFTTGGTISSIFKNFSNLLASSEYDIVSESLFSKFRETKYYFNKISFGMPYILPLFFLLLLFDKKRKDYLHRIIYLIISLIFAAVYMFGIFKEINFKACFFSLPFSLFSITCYFLTHHKNKILFFCMWIPCAIAALFQFISANTGLTSLGIVFAINNIAGVIFIRDLFKEIRVEPKAKSIQNLKLIALSRSALCAGLCLQFLFHGFVFQYEQIPGKGAVKATSGPYSQMLMTEEQYANYTKLMSDMDLIKSRNKENLPLLIASHKNWLYLCVEAPVATYTTWYTGHLNQEQLFAYYKENPEKKPKYIYIDPTDFNNNYIYDIIQNNIDTANKMFDFTQEALSCGVLLTIEEYKI